MSKMLFQSLGVLTLFVCFGFATLSAQTRTNKATTQKAGISAKDQAAIKAIFKDVDPSKYRLQFNSKRDVMGSKAVKMEDVRQVKKFTNPAEAAGWIVFVVEGDDVIYVLAVGNSDLVSVLGRQKAAQLNKIMAKYQ